MTPEQAQAYPPVIYSVVNGFTVFMIHFNLMLHQVKIEKPLPDQYELRVILWRAVGVKAMDDVRILCPGVYRLPLLHPSVERVFYAQITDMNDMFAKVWIDDTSRQESDTHWRCAEYLFLSSTPAVARWCCQPTPCIVVVVLAVDVHVY